MLLHPPKKIYITSSKIPNSGRGVFASENIEKDELIELENVYIGNYVLDPLGLKTGRQNLFLFTFSGKNLGIIFDELDEKKLQGIINGHWDLQIIKPKLYPQAFINAHKESIQTLAELKKVIE